MYLTVLQGKVGSAGPAAADLRRPEARCQPAWALIGRLWEDLVSWFLQAVGQISFGSGAALGSRGLAQDPMCHGQRGHTRLSCGLSLPLPSYLLLHLPLASSDFCWEEFLPLRLMWRNWTHLGNPSPSIGRPVTLITSTKSPLLGSIADCHVPGSGCGRVWKVGVYLAYDTTDRV